MRQGLQGLKPAVTNAELAAGALRYAQGKLKLRPSEAPIGRLGEKMMASAYWVKAELDAGLRGAEGVSGIDAHRSSRGQITCQRRYDGKHKSAADKRDWIGCAGLKQQAGHQTREGE